MGVLKIFLEMYDVGRGCEVQLQKVVGRGFLFKFLVKGGFVFCSVVSWDVGMLRGEFLVFGF